MKHSWSAMAKFCVAVAVLTLAAGCGSEPPAEKAEAQAVRPVKAVRLSSHSERIIRLPGVAQSRRDVTLSFRVGGPLVRLLVDTGQKVAADEVIAEIDPRDYELRVKTGAARLASAKAQLEEADNQFRRYEKLISTKAVAKAEYDRIKAAYEVADANVRAAVKALEDARNALADTVLRAPFAGYITQRMVDNHETVAAGAPIVAMVDPGQMEVHAVLPEGMLPQVDTFKTFSCCFDALPGRCFDAVLKEVGKQADPASRAYPLILSLRQDENQSVRPGMSAEVVVDMGPTAAGGYLVPISAVFNKGGDDTFVWLVDEAAGKVVRHRVTVDGLQGGMVQVSGDLPDGAWVVTAGAHMLLPDQQVRLLEPSSRSNIGGEM